MLSVDGVSVVMPREILLAVVGCRLCDLLTACACVCLAWLGSFALVLFTSHLFSLSVLVCFSQMVTCVVAMPDGRRVVSGSLDNTLRVWDVDTGECVRELKGHGEVSEC
jgi:WD40 repeat protein